MAVQVESAERSSYNFKIEGDLGDLQIVEESSEDDFSDDVGSECPKVNERESRTVKEGDSSKVRTLANIPNGLVQASTTPVFGTVQVTHSDNAQFGNNTYFNGPVTIKQVIQTTSGIDDASYQKTEDENTPNRKYQQNKESNPKFRVKTWHKLLFLAVIVIVVACVCAIALVTYQNNHNLNDSHDSSDCHLQAQVVGSSGNIYQIISLVLNGAITCLLWTSFHSLVALLTNRSGEKSREREYSYQTKTEVYKYSKKQKVDDLLIAPDHLRIVSRTDWLAQPVDEKINAIVQPVPWVVITHTATEGCFMQSECVLRVRIIQTFHIESRGWSDIAYNFMVGGDGSAYVGRGWDKEGAHTKGYNKYAISIAFIGTFNTETPTKHQVDACKKLIKLGVAKGKLAHDYKLLAHRQLMSTLSPGDKVFEIVKTWPHFFDKTDISAIIPRY